MCRLQKHDGMQFTLSIDGNVCSSIEVVLVPRHSLGADPSAHKQTLEIIKDALVITAKVA